MPRTSSAVNRIVSELGEAEAAVLDAQNTPRGVLRVTAPPDLGMVILPKALPEFTALYPEVHVVLDLSGRRSTWSKRGSTWRSVQGTWWIRH